MVKFYIENGSSVFIDLVLMKRTVKGKLSNMFPNKGAPVFDRFIANNNQSSVIHKIVVLQRYENVGHGVSAYICASHRQW